MPSTRSEKRSWTRPWKLLRRHVVTVLPRDVDDVNQLQSSTRVSLLAAPSASNSPSRSLVNISIQARPVTPSTTSPAKDAQVALNGLHELLKILKEFTGFFAPLKSTVGGLLSCIEIYQVCGLTELMMRTHILVHHQRTSGNHKEMDGVMNKINRLSSILARELPNCQASLTTHQAVNGLAKYISTSCLEAQLLILASTVP
jgi:hypothetical protein